MRGAVLHAPRDVRFDERAEPKIEKPTDAIVRLSATCVCGSDLWPYRGIAPVAEPTPMGHEYCGIVEEVGRDVRAVRKGQFVIGSFFASDNTCPNCHAGYQTSCLHSAGAAPARPARRRHSRCHARGANERSRSEPSHAFGRDGNGLVRRRRGERQARPSSSATAPSVCSPFSPQSSWARNASSR